MRLWGMLILFCLGISALGCGGGGSSLTDDPSSPTSEQPVEEPQTPVSSSNLNFQYFSQIRSQLSPSASDQFSNLSVVQSEFLSVQSSGDFESEDLFYQFFEL